MPTRFAVDILKIVVIVFKPHKLHHVFSWVQSLLLNDLLHTFDDLNDSFDGKDKHKEIVEDVDWSLIAIRLHVPSEAQDESV